MLFDLMNDPGENRNLARENLQIVERLTKAHTARASKLQPEAIMPPTRSTLAEMDGETVQLIF
ncbi:MAG: hypothetical protein ACI96M_003106 [Candidatus Azotimanducaceae bacterium]|jgi:hypothetical protein